MCTSRTTDNSSYFLRIFLTAVQQNPSSEKDASLALTARALSSYLGLEPSPEILARKARTPEGKPYFPDYPDFHYNISHSGSYAACGMICGGRAPQPIGIDIQEIPSAPRKALKIADHFFSEAERGSLRLLVNRGDISTALLLFCRYWTARESYIKLTGRGLAEPFGSYYPDLEHGRIVVPGSDRQIYLTECTAPAGYCLSVCSYVAPEKNYHVETMSMC